MRKTTFKIVALTAIWLVLILANCDTNPQSSDRSDFDYRLNGVLVCTQGEPACLIHFDMQREDSTFSDAEIILGNDTISWRLGHYWKIISDSIDNAGLKNLTIRDADLFADTLSITRPGELSVSISGLPENRINPGGASVNISWTASEYAEGYYLIVYKLLSGSWEPLHSAWVTSGATSTTITPDAFRWSNGIEVDTGWYRAFICSYTGSPDSSLSRSPVDVLMPGNLSDNIDKPDLTGRIGAIMRSSYDSIHVVAR